jgi:hypothetical protein
MRVPFAQLDGTGASRVASGKKEAPHVAGLIGRLLACCGGVLSLFFFLSDAVFVEPLAKERASAVPDDSYAARPAE